MTVIQTYHRPPDVATALQLLARDGVRTAVLAGGVHLNAHRPADVEEVVDLQDLGLDEVKRQGQNLTVGAMTRLQVLVEHEDVPEVMRLCAHRAGPNTFRNQGTLGGVIVGANPESELLAALLVYEAEVTVQTLAGVRRLPLSDFWADVPAARQRGLLTAVSLAVDGVAACERVARTPADAPIVAVVGRRRSGEHRLAFCGLASTPVLLSTGEVEALTPPADFRGSSDYRRHMAHILSQRVLRQLDQTQGA